ncbi:MAG: DUF4387 domain-containing protein [Acidimicrobiales bacterium]
MKLSQAASLVRSKNAGPFELTFDILFEDVSAFLTAVEADVVNAAYFARTFRCPESSVRVYICPNARAIKATIPRPKTQGTFGDADLHGGQQYAPLLELEI